MKRKILDFSIMKEEITQNNVLEMTELIAFMELRFQIGYSGSRTLKMYADLYANIKHKNELGYIKHHVDFEFAAENIVRTVRIVTF